MIESTVHPKDRLMRLTKCHGSGNDFYLVDRRETMIDESDLAPLAVSLSRRSGPFGADGLLIVDDGEVGPRMRIFNSDGSEAEMCGNGLRCVGRHLLDGSSDERVLVETRRESIAVRRVEELAPGVQATAYQSSAVSFAIRDWLLGHDNDELKQQPIPSLHDTLPFTAIRFPNPHVITVTERVSLDELVRLGSTANSTPSVFPEGVNVSMIRPLGPRSLYCATFERGVGLTMACGTAMSASAVVAASQGLVPTGETVEVFTWGGKVRIVVADDLASVAVEGNATVVFTTELPLRDALDPGPELTVRAEASVDEITAYEQLLADVRSELLVHLTGDEYGGLQELEAAK